MQYLISSLIIFLCAVSLPVRAQNVPSILEAIEKDSIVTIQQPDGLIERLRYHSVTTITTDADPKSAETSSQRNEDLKSQADNASATGTNFKSAGYRVQVFSDNNVKSAKTEARSKAQAIQARLPQYRTYVVYQSPYWRLKVGDFLTLTEAENAADEIKKIFPSFSREVRVVKDRINRQ